MISLEIFEKIMRDIELQEKKDDELTKLLVNDGCYGWISTADALVNDLLLLLKDNLNDEYDYINWWLYDVSDGDKFVYEPFNDTHECVMDLNTLEDLYYYIIGDHENVTQFAQPKQKRETFTQNCSMDDVMGTIFGEQNDCGGYTVDDIYEYLGKAKKPDISNVKLR